MATVLQSIRKFIPTTGDNDKKPESEQIVAWIRNLSINERQKQIRKFMAIKPDEFMQKLMEDTQANEIKDILIKNVVKFDNFEFNDVDEATGESKGTRAIKMGDLIEQGEIALCMELFMNILNSSQLSKAQVKNSESQSGTTPELSRSVLEGTVLQ